MHIAPINHGPALTAHQVHVHWQRLHTLILRAIPQLGGTHDEADCLAEIMNGAWTFWPGAGAFIFAAIETYPKLKRVNLVLASGDHNECAALEPAIVAWARARGATKSITFARPALDRLDRSGKSGYYSGSGYARGRILYCKDI